MSGRGSPVAELLIAVVILRYWFWGLVFGQCQSHPSVDCAIDFATRGVASNQYL